MIARKSTLIVVSQFFIRFIGWIGLVILAKLWGSSAPEALGVIGFSMAFVSLFTFIGDLGFTSAHVKRVSEGKDLGECIGTFITIKVILTILMLISIGLTIFIGSSLFNINFYDSTTGIVILIFILYFVVTNFVQMSVITFQGTKEIAKRQLVMVVENLVKVPLFIIVIVLGSEAVSYGITGNWLELLSLTYLLGIVGSMLIGFWMLRKYPLKRPTKKMFKSYFIFALPVMMLALVSVFSVNIDKVMIGYFWTSVEVGYYFTVQQVIQVILIFSAGIGLILFPTLSEYHSNNKFEEIKKTIHLAMRYISMAIIPMIVAIIIFAGSIISIMLSDAFLPATTVLIVLTIMAFVTALGTPFNSTIVGMNRPGIAAKIGIVMCASNIVLNFAFIPKNGLLSTIGISGALGVAVATAMSCFIGFFGFCLAVKKLTGIKLMKRPVFIHMIAGVTMGAVLYLFKIIGETNISIFMLILYIATGFAVYLGVLALLKEFTKEDFKFFLNLCHPKEMIKYIRGEFKK